MTSDPHRAFMSPEGFGDAVLFLTEQDVDRLLPMDDALREVEAALRDLGEGKAENRPRQRVHGDHALLNVMAASWPRRGYFGFKEYSVSRGGARFWFHLFDASSGEPVALMQANRLGQRRTGAASGVAAKFLARPDAATVGIVGAGWQAESQLEAICRVRPISEIRCYSRDEARRHSFAERMSRLLGVPVRAASSPEQAVHDVDIVVAATNSSKPVLRGEWIAPGAHINAMGANRVESRELDVEVIRRCNLVSVDSIEQARLEAGDLVQPAKAKLLDWNDVVEIGTVVGGKAKGRRRAKDVTLFKSLGLAIEDVAVGALVYERARKEGIGTVVPL